jgi:hypothetical protein
MKKENVKLISIPSDSEAAVIIGGAFYQRLNKLLIDFGDSNGKNQLIESMYRIQRQNIAYDDAYTFNLETLIILLRDVEKAFVDSGQSKENIIDLELPDDYKEIELKFKPDPKQD